MKLCRVSSNHLVKMNQNNCHFFVQIMRELGEGSEFSYVGKAHRYWMLYD
jgi:hypothetical protein